MGVDILIEEAQWGDIAPLASRAVEAALHGAGLDPHAFHISLLACNDDRIAGLNADFRQKGQPTNVLSWPSVERGAQMDGDMPIRPVLPRDAELGDIAISYKTCLQEANAAGTPFNDHVTHLLIHGTLHLLGFDHVRNRDAALMEGLETEILGNLDIPDPYS